MIVKLLTEHHLGFLSLKGGCRGSSKSTHVKMPYCWKSHVTAHIFFLHMSARRWLHDDNFFANDSSFIWLLLSKLKLPDLCIQLMGLILH